MGEMGENNWSPPLPSRGPQAVPRCSFVRALPWLPRASWLQVSNMFFSSLSDISMEKSHIDCMTLHCIGSPLRLSLKYRFSDTHYTGTRTCCLSMLQISNHDETQLLLILCWFSTALKSLAGPSSRRSTKALWFIDQPASKMMIGSRKIFI